MSRSIAEIACHRNSEAAPSENGLNAKVFLILHAGTGSGPGNRMQSTSLAGRSSAQSAHKVARRANKDGRASQFS